MHRRRTTSKEAQTSTKEALLNAACFVFAERGFVESKVADICHQAGTNIASVNYHFGCKEHLFMEAIRHAHKVALDRYPLSGNLGPDAAAEERLHAFVHAVVSRILDEEIPGTFHRMLGHEFARGHSCMNRIVQDTVKQDRRVMLAAVAEILDIKLNPVQEHLVTHLVITPLVGLAMHRVRNQRSDDALRRAGKPEVFSQMYTRYIVGGLCALKEMLPEMTFEELLEDMHIRAMDHECCKKANGKTQNRFLDED